MRPSSDIKPPIAGLPLKVVKNLKEITPPLMASAIIPAFLRGQSPDMIAWRA